MAQIKKAIESYSQKIGRNKLLVQGSGGNISWKTRNNLWVKASGKSLKNAMNENIFIPLGLSDINHELNAVSLKSKLIPSIETMMHAIISHKIVVHLHSVEILSVLIKKDCDKILGPFLNKNPNICLIKYCKPGNKLANEISIKLEKNSMYDIFLLKNHGIVVAANSIDVINKRINWLIKEIGNIHPENVQHKSRIPEKIKKDQLLYVPIKNKKLHALAQDKLLFRKMKRFWAIYPDHIVFLGKSPILFLSRSDFLKSNFVASNRNIIFIKNVGIYTKSDFSNTYTIELLEAFYNVLLRIKINTRIRCLTKKEIDDLYLWDREKFRLQNAI